MFSRFARAVRGAFRLMRLMAAGGFALCLIAPTRTTAAELPVHFVLELDIAIERGGTTGVLFDFGDGIWGENSAVAAVPPGRVPQTVRLLLPTRPIRDLRFDPTADDSEVLISEMRLLSDRGQLLLKIDPRTLRPLHQIEAITPEGTGVRIRPTAKADDPMLLLDLAPLQKRMNETMRRPTVRPATVIGLALVMAAFVAVTVLAVVFSLSRGAALLGGLAIFPIVFGVRLALLNAFSRPVPFWDEWEGDVLYILIPFVGGFLDWGALVMPQWEHRILVTRIITLFGTIANGEWDPRIAMTIGAAMFSTMVAIIGTALLTTKRRCGAVAALALTVAAALPYDFNNLLWGGQTQMYALAVLAVCMIGLASAPLITRTIEIAACMGAAVSLFTMGAGLLGPACAAGICLVRAWYEPSQRFRLGRLSAIFAAFVIVGFCLHVKSRAHAPLYATSFAQFQHAFVGVLAWPLPPRLIWAAVIWVSWIVNGVLILRRRAATPLEWIAVGLGGWALVNAFALGYARPYEGPPFDSRFFTSFTIGVCGSICSSVSLAIRAPTAKLCFFPGAPICAVVVGMLIVGRNGIEGARENGLARAELDHRIRTFLATGNPAAVLEKPPHHGANGAHIVHRLESPLLQQILPAPYRRALVSRNSASSVVTTPAAGWLTSVVRTLMKGGIAVAALGLIGAALAGWRLRADWGERRRG